MVGPWVTWMGNTVTHFPSVIMTFIIRLVGFRNGWVCLVEDVIRKAYIYRAALVSPLWRQMCNSSLAPVPPGLRMCKRIPVLLQDMVGEESSVVSMWSILLYTTEKIPQLHDNVIWLADTATFNRCSVSEITVEVGCSKPVSVGVASVGIFVSWYFMCSCQIWSSAFFSHHVLQQLGSKMGQ